MRAGWQRGLSQQSSLALLKEELHLPMRPSGIQMKVMTKAECLAILKQTNWQRCIYLGTKEKEAMAFVISLLEGLTKQDDANRKA